MHIHTKPIMNNQVTDIGEADERDGIRFTFNTWPGTRMEATKCVIPMGCLYVLQTIHLHKDTRR